MSATPIRILLVEDNPGDAVLIREMLDERAETRFELTHVARLSHALDALDALDEGEFGVVLLDLSLPDSNGIDTFRTLRDSYPRVPVVVLTGLDDGAVAVQALQLGGQDYLVKGNIASRQLEHALSFALFRHQSQLRVADSLLATEAEFDIARRIHQVLLPREQPVVAGLDVYGASRSATAVGGDLFRYLDLADNRFGMAIADATGHGLGPSLLMVAVRSYLRTFEGSSASPGQILTAVNRLFADDVSDGNNCTMLLAAWDPVSRSLEYASAGHPSGLLLRADGTLKAQLYSTGIPLGILPDVVFSQEPPTPLEPGDVLILHTDGVSEARSRGGEWFGSERIARVVREERDRCAREIVEAILAKVWDFSAGMPQGDDVTVLVVKMIDSA